MKKNKFIGSDFDNFLDEKGIREEIELAALKKIIAYELKQEMKRNKITQTEMAQRLKTSRTAVTRLLNPENYSITLLTLHKLAKVLGKDLDIRFN